ncbi:MAG: AAA family ATPase [Thermoleophilia bacterium]
MRSLADIAEDHNVRQFVGRAEELAFLAAVVDAERPDPPLVFIHGPGGVGKTSLVEATRRIAGAERRWVWVDAARIDPTPPEVANALAAVTEPEAGGGAVVVIDGFERLVHLERWFTETVIPGFPDGTAVLITSRRPPGPAWVTSPLIRPLLHSLPLRNLPADDTRRLLGQLGVGRADADSIIATHGHRWRSCRCAACVTTPTDVASP